LKVEYAYSFETSAEFVYLKLSN